MIASLAAAILSCLCSLGLVDPPQGKPPTRAYDAWLASPGGPIRFRLELVEAENGALRAMVINGREHVPAAEARVNAGELVIRFEPYDSEIRAKPGPEADTFDGAWIRRRGPGEFSTMAFHATPMAPLPLTRPIEATLAERWSVRFEGDEEPVVGIFTAVADGRAYGTIMTTTGDYRYLGGTFDGRTLELSSFNGSGAVLMRAVVAEDGTMAGEMWSGPTSREAFTATPDPGAALPDDLSLTTATADPDLSALAFLDKDGSRVPLASLIDGPAIIHIFGTWCPNCNDAARLIGDFHATYAERGLDVVGLAFELTGDRETDQARIEAYRARHGAAYPLLLAGTAKKDNASAALPFLDRVRAFPTTVFLDRHGKVVAVHSGFSGPATGEAHEALKARLTAIVERIVAE